MTPSPLPDLLVRHGGFLRRLARALTASEADADDLVQDTWVAALERPPAHWEAPRGWLGRAARRLNGKRHRSARRRDARETIAARPEAVEAPEDATLVLREVVEAVLTLDEPDRRTVVARYFEDLSILEIARREGVSVPTVKGRLRRSLERLRSRLDSKHDGDRERWCVALTAFASWRAASATLVGSACPATFATGVLLMSFQAKAVTGLSIAFALVLGLAWRGAETTPPPVSPHDASSVDEVSTTGVLPTGEASRTAVDVESDAGTAHATVDSGPTSTLEILVTDLDGVPASGVEVLAAPPGHPLDRVGTTDGDGELTVRWAPNGRGRSSRELVVALRAKGEILGGLRRFSIPVRETRRLVAAIDPRLVPDGDVWLSSTVQLIRSSAVVSYGLRGTKDTMVLPSFDQYSVVETPESEVRHRRGPLEPEAETVESEVHSRRLFVGGAGPSAPSGAYRHPTTLSLSYGNLVVDGIAFAASEDGEPARVSGIVRDLSGQPAEGVRIAARSDGRLLASVRSGPDGAYELEVPGIGLELVAGPLDPTGARERFVLEPSGECTWNPFVDRGLTLRGRARDATVEPLAPLANGRVEGSHVLDDGLWLGVAVVDDEGRFTLPRCPSQIIAVDLARPDVVAGLPLARYDAVATGGEPWEVSVDPKATASVELLPEDADPTGPLAGELRIWDPAGLRGARMGVTGEAGSPVQVSLPSGEWSLSLGSSGPHWSESIPVSLAAGDEIDLGPVAFRSWGWLELPPPAEGETFRVIREGGPTRSVVAAAIGHGFEEPVLLPLPIDRYRIELRADEATTVVRELEVRSAQRAAFTR